MALHYRLDADRGETIAQVGFTATLKVQFQLASLQESVAVRTRGIVALVNAKSTVASVSARTAVQARSGFIHVAVAFGL